MKHFSFEGKYYEKTDGVAMGLSLAPGLANFFMSHYEKEWLSNFDEVSSSFFLAFNSYDGAKRFFPYLNSRDPNVKFTMETEVNTKLFPFWMFLLIIVTIF